MNSFDTIIKHINSKLLPSLLLLVASFAFAACSDKTEAEEASEEIEESLEDAADESAEAAEDAADETEDFVDDAT